MKYLALACLLIMAATIANAQTFTESWATQSLATNGWIKHGGCYTNPPNSYNSVDWTDDPCTPGNKVIRMVNKMSDGNLNCSGGDAEWAQEGFGSCPTSACWSGKHRNEITITSNTIRPDINDDVWWRFSIFVMASSPTPEVDWVVSQMIPAPYDGTDWDLRAVRSGNWQFQTRKTAAGATIQYEAKTLGPIRPGEWTNFVIRYKRSVTTAGIAQVWYNGVQKVDYTGRTSQSTEPNGIIKHGLYYARKVPTTLTGTYTYLFDDDYIAYSSSLGAVAPLKTAGACTPGVAPPDVPPGTFPTTPVVDHFDTDQNPIAGNWVNGLTGTGSCVANSGVMKQGTGTKDCYWNTQYGTTQEVYATVPVVESHVDTNSARLLACSQQIGTGADGYEIRVRMNAGATQLAIDQLDNAVYTQLGSLFTHVLTNNDKFGLQVESSGALTGFSDQGSGWGSRMTRTGTLTSCANTYIGVNLRDGTHQFDDLGGGTTVGGGSTLNVRLLGGHGGFME